MNLTNEIRKKRKFNILHIIIIISIVSTVFLTDLMVSNAYTSQNGIVNGTYVRVRSGPGTSYEALTYSGETIYLHTGHNVTIIDETNAADGYLWYQINFTYSGANFTGYMRGDFITISSGSSYTPDADFEAYLTAQGFPESYKESLRVLHTKYPNWVFEAEHINYNWSDVLAAESVVGRSLIAYNSISSWKSLANGAYDWGTGAWTQFDGTAWAAASEELVAYCLDPRNFLDEQSVFQYETLSYNTAYHTLSGVQSMVTGTFLNSSVEGKTYSQIFMEAASQSGVSPYHLVARVIQEQGSSGTSGAISGTYSGYNNIFNYFNVGAYAANGKTAVENGLIYASLSDSALLRPWNSRYKSIVGGAIKLGTSYINIGQDTLYYQKFDFVGIPYTHQYMTHILAPSKESITMSKAYSDSLKGSLAITFSIPVYNNMPASASTCPTGTGSPNNVLASLSVNSYSLTPTFSKFTTAYDLNVDNSVSSINLTAAAVDSSASVSGTGIKNLAVGTNIFNINVTSASGSVRTYTVTIIRQQPTTTGDTPAAGVEMKSTYNVSGNGYISGITVGTNVSTASSNFTLTNCTGKFLNPDGSQNNGTIGTGTKYVVYNNSGEVIKEYPIIIYGDLNGDGLITSLDMLYLKRSLLNISSLSGAYAQAANIDKDGNGITSKDMLYLKRHILNISTIVQ